MMSQAGSGSILALRLSVSGEWTAGWAERPYRAWPCSVLAGRRVDAVLDARGLIEISPGDVEVPADELTALLASALLEAIPADIRAAMLEELADDQ